MKKYLGIIAVLASIIVPQLAGATVDSYTITPSTPTIETATPIEIQGEVSNPPMGTLGVKVFAYGLVDGPILVTGCASTTVTPYYSFDVTQPYPDEQYNEVYVAYYSTSDCSSGFISSEDLEGDGSSIIFTIEDIVTSDCADLSNPDGTIATSSLGCVLDQYNADTFSMFQVLGNKFFPYMIGMFILVAVWFFGRMLWNRFK